MTIDAKNLEEVEAWAVVTPCGTVRSVWIEEFWAKEEAASPAFTPPALVVRLTGKATLPPREKD